MAKRTEPAEAAKASQPPPTKLCLLLSQASYNLTTELTVALAGLDLSPRAHEVLAAAKTGDHTQIELAQMVGLDKTTMVVTLDELETAGLIERRRSSVDRRAHIIVVTEVGERKLLEAEKIVEQVHADVLSALPTRDRQAFLDTLTLLVTDRLSRPVATAHPMRRRAPRVPRS